MIRAFIKGLKLSELFYEEAVKPIVDAHFPCLTYSAALIGLGSDVLGFDTPQSMDHDWGPRLMLYLTEADYQTFCDEIDQTLRQGLPDAIYGCPTNLAITGADGVVTGGTSDLTEHSVVFLTVRRFFRHVLNFDPTGDIRAVDWLSVPDHYLLGLTEGRVFHDGLGQLEPIRAKLGYYPHDVWLYLLAAQWRRIGQEEAILGRCGQVGDDLGSRLVAARQVSDLMRLCFLMERRYVPYIKWFGTAFVQLDCAGCLAPIFTHVLEANSWQEREEHLTTAYEFIAKMHNNLDITKSLPTQVSRYFSRPFLVIQADRFVDAIRAVITSKEVLALPENLGSIDQFVDSTDALNYLDRFKVVYG